jgi:hypothetical protein
LNTAIANVSSGDPRDRWKLWANWFALLAISFALAWVVGATRIGREYPYVFLGAMFFALYRHRMLVQHLDLVVEQKLVHVTLFLDVRSRIWIDWNSQGFSGRACIGKSFRIPTWLDYEIELDRQRYNLRIYAKKYPDGYMISNYGRGFEMTVVDNRFVLGF